MAYLARYQKRNRALTGIGAPEALQTAAAWFWVSELIRRHPGTLKVIEGVYPSGNGTVWFVNRRSPGKTDSLSFGKVLCRVYERAHITQTHADSDRLCPVTEKLGEGDDDRFQTIDGALSPEPRLMIQELEDCVGLGVIEQTPPTDQTSIGARFIAEALNLFALSRRPLGVQAGLYDGVSIRHYLFAPFPLLQHLSVEPLGTGQTGEREIMIAASSWFVLVDLGQSGNTVRWDPFAAVDIENGVFVTRAGQRDLMKEFRASGRDITALALRLVQDAAVSST